MTKRKTKEQGMTLLEVMVALVIFSTAALALMNSVTLNVRFTHSLSETLQAGWVGTETMGGQTWTWHIQRVKTAENTFADEVRVYSEGSDAQPVVALQLAEPEVDRE